MNPVRALRAGRPWGGAKWGCPEEKGNWKNTAAIWKVSYLPTILWIGQGGKTRMDWKEERMRHQDGIDLK